VHKGNCLSDADSPANILMIDKYHVTSCCCRH